MRATSRQMHLETSGYLNHLIQKTSTNPRQRIHPELRKRSPNLQVERESPASRVATKKKHGKTSGTSVKYIGIWISFSKYLSEANSCFSNINMWIKFWNLHLFTPQNFFDIGPWQGGRDCQASNIFFRDYCSMLVFIASSLGSITLKHKSKQVGDEKISDAPMW